MRHRAVELVAVPGMGQLVGDRRHRVARQAEGLVAEGVALQHDVVGRGCAAVHVGDRLGVSSCLGGDHRQVVGRAAGRRGGEEVVAQAEVGRVVPIDGDVTALVLHLAQRIEAVHLAAVDRGQRPRPVVADVVRCRVGGRRLGDTGGSGEGSEVVVEGVVLLHDHDDVLDGTGLGTRRRRPEHQNASSQHDQGRDDPASASHSEPPRCCSYTAIPEDPIARWPRFHVGTAPPSRRVATQPNINGAQPSCTHDAKSAEPPLARGQ